MGPAKRPAYQWYPGDFRRDLAVQACSWEARSLWRDMLDFMHDGEPYGHLTAGGVPLDTPTLARLIGLPSKKVAGWLSELESRGVFSRTESGTIYSRRMVRDEEEYRAFVAKQTENGKHGGRPRKETQPKPNGNPDETQAVTQTEPRGKAKGKAKKTSAVCSLQSSSKNLEPTAASPNGSAPFPVDLCQRLHEAWTRHAGGVEYPFFRKALAPLYPSSGGLYPESEMERAIWAFATVRDVQPPKEQQWWHPKKFASEIHNWARLGQQGIQHEDGTFTELGRLAMQGVA